LRAVYRNDPVPTLPTEAVLIFYHGGTEIHFYDCINAYLQYPKYTDDSPHMEPGAFDDHGGYFCLSITNEEE
jgi:hypothetical protein